MKHENLEAISIDVGNNKQEHRVYDHETESFLCFGLDYTTSRGKIMVYYPLGFNSHAYAQEFIDQKKTIASIQESLHNLNVGFIKNSVSFRPFGYQDRAAKLERMSITELLDELPDNLVLAKDNDAPETQRWMIQYRQGTLMKSCVSKDPKTTLLECLLKL